MNAIPFERIQSYRAGTFQLQPGKRLSSQDQAVEFVNQRGFIYFWPIRDITLPSLWVAAAGDRPVADAHDDPGHITWGWKDELLGQRRWYYAKVLRKRATIISLETAPYFYALTENYGSIEDDYLTVYEQGRMTQEAKTVYETLLFEGPMHTVALRKAANLTSRESDSRFSRALVDLQVDFKILPTGVARAGGWNYAFIYDIAARHFPELPDQARLISEKTARKKLVELYLRSVGAAPETELFKLFGWVRLTMEKTTASLAQDEVLVKTEVENQKGTWVALKDL